MNQSHVAGPATYSIELLADAKGTPFDTNQLKFWGLQGGDAHWAFNIPCCSSTACVTPSKPAGGQTTRPCRSTELQQDALHPNTPPFAFNRIDVGFFNSSGSLEGLLAGLQIGVPAMH